VIFIKVLVGWESSFPYKWGSDLGHSSWLKSYLIANLKPPKIVDISNIWTVTYIIALLGI